MKCSKCGKQTEDWVSSITYESGRLLLEYVHCERCRVKEKKKNDRNT